jgi:DNA-binding phage protein
MESYPRQLLIYQSEEEDIPFSIWLDSYLIESLKDPQEAAAYLDAVLEDCNYDELCLALRNVAEARISVTGSSQIDSRYEIFQNLLSTQSQLDLTFLSQALGDLGLKLSLVPSA